MSRHSVRVYTSRPIRGSHITIREEVRVSAGVWRVAQASCTGISRAARRKWRKKEESNPKPLSSLCALSRRPRAQRGFSSMKLEESSGPDPQAFRLRLISNQRRALRALLSVLVPHQGLEPRSPDSESGVLPLHQRGLFFGTLSMGRSLAPYSRIASDSVPRRAVKELDVPVGF